MKEFTVKEDQAFRLRVKSWKCLTPNTLNAIEFVHECIKDGDVINTSTYQFFMTDEEMKTLARGLIA